MNPFNFFLEIDTDKRIREQETGVDYPTFSFELKKCLKWYGYLFRTYYKWCCFFVLNVLRLSFIDTFDIMWWHVHPLSLLELGIIVERFYIVREQFLNDQQKSLNSYVDEIKVFNAEVDMVYLENEISQIAFEVWCCNIVNGHEMLVYSYKTSLIHLRMYVSNETLK